MHDAILADQERSARRDDPRRSLSQLKVFAKVKAAFVRDGGDDDFFLRERAEGLSVCADDGWCAGDDDGDSSRSGGDGLENVARFEDGP